ncbi:MAG: hypothetical protein JAY67_03375 [Candidatus Thiodiazotropha taylori]|nr:hypothetical protein [Candidatus Thiodiazotropha taylori]RLW62776.1 MAG: hypothetical protein B6D73_17830 [gamma proteobacterium symbiont of Stewartia floridana]MCG7924559.1 hypothetical protein [Candidatus Thiodiazotropha taylori]MCG7934609.1 hypothetical protein [Candidatus Thiodiazotropha taylori]MCG7970225.1 hypothetical protein [Candidatus Thiodiazotropha taylori]
MILLPNSRNAWQTDQFNETLKQELESVDPISLPLQKNLALSSYVSDEPFSIMVIQSHQETRAILVKVGIIYSGVEAGCNCADDPTPIETQPEYCEIMLSIDIDTAETTVVDPLAS